MKTNERCVLLSGIIMFMTQRVLLPMLGNDDYLFNQLRLEVGNVVAYTMEMLVCCFLSWVVYVVSKDHVHTRLCGVMVCIGLSPLVGFCVEELFGRFKILPYMGIVFLLYTVFSRND